MCRSRAASGHRLCVLNLLILLYVSVLPACMYVYTHHWCLDKSEEGIRFPEIGVMHGCEPLCGYWKLNPGPLQEQPLFLTFPAPIANS